MFANSSALYPVVAGVICTCGAVDSAIHSGLDDALAVPHAAVEIHLADLEQVARSHERAAAVIALAVRRQVPVVATELQRSRDGAFEQLRQPRARRGGERATDEIVFAEQ